MGTHPIFESDFDCLTDLEMSLIESCAALGIEISHSASLDEIIELLQSRSDDLKVKLLLGIALQEAERDTEAYKVFEESAAKGSVSGMYQQAAYLYDGRGAEKDTERAISLMERVVDESNPKTQNELIENALLNLGRAYWDTFPHNSQKAEECWTRAANGADGLVEAMTELGEFYAHPENNDLRQSFHWHQNAAGKGSTYSQAVIGIMYLKGQGIEQSTVKALKCLKEAAAAGSLYARANLAELYYKKKLFTESVTHAKKVCDQHKEEGPFKDRNEQKGVTLAAFVYARCLQLGRGTPSDSHSAQALFKLAAQTDPIVACKLHNDLIQGAI